MNSQKQRTLGTSIRTIKGVEEQPNAKICTICTDQKESNSCIHVVVSDRKILVHREAELDRRAMSASGTSVVKSVQKRSSLLSLGSDSGGGEPWETRSCRGDSFCHPRAHFCEETGFISRTGRPPTEARTIARQLNELYDQSSSHFASKRSLEECKFSPCPQFSPWLRRLELVPP